MLSRWSFEIVAGCRRNREWGDDPSENILDSLNTRRKYEQKCTTADDHGRRGEIQSLRYETCEHDSTNAAEQSSTIFALFWASNMLLFRRRFQCYSNANHSQSGEELSGVLLVDPSLTSLCFFFFLASDRVFFRKVGGRVRSSDDVL